MEWAPGMCPDLPSVNTGTTQIIRIRARLTGITAQAGFPVGSLSARARGIAGGDSHTTDATSIVAVSMAMIGSKAAASRDVVSSDVAQKDTAPIEVVSLVVVPKAAVSAGVVPAGEAPKDEVTAVDDANPLHLCRSTLKCDKGRQLERCRPYLFAESSGHRVWPFQHPSRHGNQPASAARTLASSDSRAT